MKTIRKEITINLPREEAFSMWSTDTGAKRFFAPDAKVDLRIGGPYEMYFNPDAPHGERGSEGVKILSFLPHEMLSFEWNAPETFFELRNELTWVVLLFQAIDENTTRIILNHLGWSEGEEWDRLYSYFMDAWNTVLRRFVQSVEHGPIHWSNEWAVRIPVDDE